MNIDPVGFGSTSFRMCLALHAAEVPRALLANARPPPGGSHVVDVSMRMPNHSHRREHVGHLVATRSGTHQEACGEHGSFGKDGAV